jgi:hypothetical protein
MGAARLLAGLALWLGASGAIAFDLEALMAALAKVDRSEVAFEETRQLSVLAAPLVRRGTLIYVRPDRLEMHVVSPFPETTEVVGSLVRVTSSEQRREWDLTGQPAAMAWIEAIRASLAGDAATLARLFRIELTGTADAWQMMLEPRDARVAAALRRVLVQGRHVQLATIEIIDRQGDRVVIALKSPARGAR